MSNPLFSLISPPSEEKEEGLTFSSGKKEENSSLVFFRTFSFSFSFSFSSREAKGGGGGGDSLLFFSFFSSSSSFFFNLSSLTPSMDY